METKKQGEETKHLLVYQLRAGCSLANKHCSLCDRILPPSLSPAHILLIPSPPHQLPSVSLRLIYLVWKWVSNLQMVFRMQPQLARAFWVSALDTDILWCDSCFYVFLGSSLCSQCLVSCKMYVMTALTCRFILRIQL